MSPDADFPLFFDFQQFIEAWHRHPSHDLDPIQAPDFCPNWWAQPEACRGLKTDPWMINWWNPKIHKIPANSHMAIGINFEVYPTCREHWIGNMKSFTRINGTLATTTTTPTQNSASILARSGVQGLTGIVTNCVFTSKSRDKRNNGLDWQTSAPAKSERVHQCHGQHLELLALHYFLSKVPNTHEKLPLFPTWHCSQGPIGNLWHPRPATPLVFTDLPRIKKHRGFKASMEHHNVYVQFTNKIINNTSIIYIYNKYLSYTYLEKQQARLIYLFIDIFEGTGKRLPRDRLAFESRLDSPLSLSVC